ncbi:glycosyltransferase family 4 protein [Streptomyces sp. NPDC060194]|uniref:glycosyltransferase family 4 protein n=1 Tax=Streptomyces sp. NPDC060194 TaxID=3347069 RepID=UPI003659EDB6
MTQLRAVQVLGGGGAHGSAHVRSLTAGLVARGLHVTVCAPEETGRAYDFGGAGARVVPSPALRAACADADLVHAHGLHAALRAALALRGSRTPLVVTWHHRAHADGARAQVLRLLERRVVRAASVVLATSSELVDAARHRGARDARLAPVAIPAPRPAPGESKARAELGAMGRPLVIAVGSLYPGRGYDTLLDAARAWRSLEPLPLLVVAGEGPERAALQRRIDAEELPVRLLGRRTDVADLLAVADLAVVPSRWEARSVLAQEALHAGVPLVATAVGGTPDLVGDAALLVPADDPGALAGAVAGLLADPEERARLALRGTAQAAAWPTEHDTVAQVLSVYDELTAYGHRG